MCNIYRLETLIYYKSECAPSFTWPTKPQFHVFKSRPFSATAIYEYSVCRHMLTEATCNKYTLKHLGKFKYFCAY